MKNNDEFHTSIKVSRTGKVRRYSEKAYQSLAAAIAAEGADNLWSQAKEGKTLDPRAFSSQPKATASLAPKERTA